MYFDAKMYCLDIALVFLLTITSYPLVSSSTLCESTINDSCISCLNKPMTLTCQQNETVTGFIYAGFRSSDAVCTPKAEDCIVEPVIILSKILQCMWNARACMFTLNSYDVPRYPTCPLDVKPVYLMAEHVECIQDRNIHRMCLDGNHNLLASSSSTTVKYIISPKFQFPYSQNIQFDKNKCFVNIRTSSIDFGISIRSLFIDIKDDKEGRCVDDYIELCWTDGNSGLEIKRRFCGRDEVQIEVESDYVRMLFVIGSEVHGHQGFVLSYSAIPKKNVIYTTTDLEDVTHAVNDTPATVKDKDNIQTTTPTNKSSTKDTAAQTMVIVIVFISLVIIMALVTIGLVTAFAHIKSKYRGYTVDNKATKAVTFVSLKDSMTDVSEKEGSISNGYI